MKVSVTVKVRLLLIDRKFSVGFCHGFQQLEESGEEVGKIMRRRKGGFEEEEYRVFFSEYKDWQSQSIVNKINN